MTDAAAPHTSTEPPRKSLPQRAIRTLQDNWRRVVIAIPFVWLLVFFLTPFFIVAKISLAELAIASPPFTPMFEWMDGGILTIRLVFDNFVFILFRRYDFEIIFINNFAYH